MSQVREASIEWLSLTIQKERPEQHRPRELAETLLDVAEEFYVPVEELRGWIQQQEAYATIDARSFQPWAKAYDDARAKATEQMNCGHCGASIQRSKAHEHKCQGSLIDVRPSAL